MTLQNRNFTSVFAIRSSFRAKGLHLIFQKCNFTPVFDIRPSFRARGLHLKFQNCYFTSGWLERIQGEQQEMQAKLSPPQDGRCR